MTYTFYKYQGTGNDFILIDNRQKKINKNDTKLIKHFCDRRFGIGADGLILLEDHEDLDFKMVYFNADGNESTMCGNGGRCIVDFAHFMGIIKDETTFVAFDGIHSAVIDKNLVKLNMKDVAEVKQFDTHVFLNTGSPHHVQLESNLEDFDIKLKGSEIRYSEPYSLEGTNVNFVKKENDEVFFVRTYERGVEDETLSCGTGVTAVALAMNYIGETEKNQIKLRTKGGDLIVTFEKKGNGFNNVWLIGPVKQVYKGEIVW